MNFYHPDTLEHIRNPLPGVADWAIGTELEVPPYNPQAESCHFIGGAWVVTANGPSMTEAVTAKKTDLAAYRYDKEVGGITMANGMKVATDDRSKGLIAGARIDIIDDPTILTDFKAETGWIQIDAATVTLISSAVAAHVRTCFAIEKQHSDAIDALAALPDTTEADIYAYDITTGWPT